MSYLPCRNTSCKSYGQPHPNCRCHGAMAKGGEVSYCSGPHKEDCEYFAIGGEVGELVPTSDIPQLAETSEVPTSDLPEAVSLGEAVPEGDLPTDYSSPGQMLGTAVEGLAQGIAGPLATAAELGLSALGVPGLSAEDQAGRQKENPYIHGIAETAGFAGSMLVGTGEAALAVKAAEKVAHAAQMGKLGSSVIKGAISNGIIQGGDEVSKMMLGTADPEESIGAKLAHVGAAGLFGGAFSGAGSLTSSAAKKGLEKLAESKFGEKAEYFLYGIASAANGAEKVAPDSLPKSAKKAFDSGAKYFSSMSSHATLPAVGAATGAYHGYKEHGAEGALKGGAEGLLYGLASDIAKNKASSLGSKYIAPAMLKILSSGNLTGALQALDHAADIAKGSKAISKGIEGIFNAGGIGSQQLLKSYYSGNDREKLDKYIKNGGIDQQVQQQVYDDNDTKALGFAEGGDVPAAIENEPDGLATHYPEQDMVLNVAKGRVSNYLNSIRPEKAPPSLAFDYSPDTRLQQKSYDRALDIAVQPLSILEEIKHGTIEPEHVKHFNALYPEMSGLLQKKLTERIIQSQLDGTRPPSAIRQGLSLFMGTALSAEYTPQNIQAAQNVFAATRPQQPASKPAESGGNKAKLSKSDASFLTGNQSLVKRQQRS